MTCSKSFSTLHALRSYRLASMVTATAIIATALGITSPKAMAEVSLNLQTEYYSAKINTNAPMQKQLLNVSPISKNSKKYIGYASSKINWRFRYREDASGQCRMTSNQTTLNTIVTMPEIYGATDRQSNLFKTFYAALWRHELGHYNIAAKTAFAIDFNLTAIPPQPSCTQLSTKANELAHALILNMNEANRRYDEDTNHGRLQGAFLSE
jgi:predicted secreted Zn-dependent protease